MAATPHTPEVTDNEPINILIVDDEPKNLTVLETILDDPAYRIVRAESPDQALLALVVEEFALLILDVRLPGMTGFELAQMIKTRRRTARVPIIFLTAYYNEDQHMLEGYDTGAVDYLHKPLNPLVLRSKVAVFAELHRRNRESVAANKILLAEVTARRQAQEELRELNDCLEQRVTERTAALMRTRNALNETGERYRSLFEGSLNSIFSTNPAGFFEAANPAAMRLLGRGLDQLRTFRFADLCPVDRRETIEGAVKAAAAGEGFMLDTAVTTANGERRELFVSGTPTLVDGAVAGVSFIARDVTERRHAESALQESQTRLQLAQAAAGFGIWDRGVATGPVTWSDDQWRLHGLEPQPNGPDHDAWLGCVHPEDRARVDAEWMEGVADPERPFSIEYRALHPDGTVRWLQAKGKTTYDATARSGRVVGVTADVTTSRETEAALRRVSQELEIRVHQEIAARETAQKRAAQAERLQALGQLAGGIAHDFNNVLQAVMGALRMIEKRREDAEAFTRLTQVANGAIERGISITRRLLALGGRGELKSEPLDVSAVLRDLQELLTHTLGAGIDIMVRLEPGLYPAIADRGQLESVLVNLATNARDAMPHGGQLILSAARDNVLKTDTRHPAVLRPGRYVRLKVTDTGTGMEIATLARAREPFFTTKQAGSGTGLGLAMAHGFAEQSGGALSIESTPGEGTSVTLWLPEAAPAMIFDEDRLREEPPSDQCPPAKAARILLVDDEVVIRTILAQNLEERGYDLVVAATGAEALALAAEEKVDAVITDLSMPGVDGLAVIRGVQALHPGTPAILLTGYAGDETALALKGAMGGSYSLLLKPVTEDQLVDRVARLLSAGAEV